MRVSRRQTLRRFGEIATSTPARAVVSVGLLALVGMSIDWSALADGLADAAWGWYLLAVALFFAAFSLGAVRWHFLLDRASLAVPWSSTFRATFIGLFANNLLPTGYGGDAVRAWIVAKKGKPLARALVSVAVDRASGFLCLLALAWVAAFIKFDSVPGGIVILLGIATSLTALAGIAGLVVVRRTGLGRFLPDALRPWTSEVASVLRSYERDRGLLVRIMAIGLVYQSIVVSAFWLVAESLQLGLDPAVLALVVPTVLLAALLPISIAGFGVREGAFIVLLGEFGVSATDATLLSLLAVSAVALASSPGGLAIALDPKRERGPLGASAGGT